MNTLDELKKQTVIVVDTGDINAIKSHKPEDATTNPSLIYKAVQMPEYQYLLKKTISDHSKSNRNTNFLCQDIVDNLLINFGKEILSAIPGRVSTEVDARLSFDTKLTIERARKLINLYNKSKIDKERILIKIASTWEGIEAARVLTNEGINCNLTLLFSLPQAIACASADIKLISPFVGRVLDWYKSKAKNVYAGIEDPGVKLVRNIFNYYKKHDIETEIMGASFRNIDQILELSGCDFLTISPDLLDKLSQLKITVSNKLNSEHSKNMNIQKMNINEQSFRWLINENEMATSKLAEGIRNFAIDTFKLENQIKSIVNNS